MANPEKTAASPTRSRVESRNAPHGPEDPFTRASSPSSMSNMAKPQHTSVPANRWPMGNSHSAPTATPSVPVTVTILGVTGVRASASPSGVSSRANSGLSAFSMAVRSYWRRDSSDDSVSGLVIGWPGGKGWL